MAKRSTISDRYSMCHCRYLAVDALLDQRIIFGIRLGHFPYRRCKPENENYVSVVSDHDLSPQVRLLCICRSDYAAIDCSLTDKLG